MKKLLYLLVILGAFKAAATVEENRFENELKYLEQESYTTDEIKLIDSAILKKEAVEKQLNKNEDEENIFFKTEEVKPRRIRSR